MQYLVFETKEEASKEAYKVLREHMWESSTLGLATGSSPLDLYKEMIEDYKKNNFSYKNIKTFNLDEYVGISYSHPESYHSFMEENLFKHIDIDKKNTFIPDASSENLEEAIKEYQTHLNNSVIDVQVLGVGGNGHIGFNEPGTSFDSGVHAIDLKKDTIEANARFFDGDISKVPTRAVTMGIKDIMKAKTIILLAFGEKKKFALRALVEGEEITEDIPCTVLKNHDNVYIFADKEADFRGE